VGVEFYVAYFIPFEHQLWNEKVPSNSEKQSTTKRFSARSVYYQSPHCGLHCSYESGRTSNCNITMHGKDVGASRTEFSKTSARYDKNVLSLSRLLCVCGPRWDRWTTTLQFSNARYSIQQPRFLLRQIHVKVVQLAAIYLVVLLFHRCFLLCQNLHEFKLPYRTHLNGSISCLCCD
jgi:hypothetical protein